MRMVHRVTQWYLAHKRALPWRETTDPYAIWVSEIILQQTRVAQGLEYYLRFLEQFPSVFSLAGATEDEVLKVWQGLGYYSRARNMHASAKYIVAQCGGVFPSTYASILSLKGVGPYTAAAIASFAFKEAVLAVDGNVHRVMSRMFGICEPVGTASFNKQVAEWAPDMMDPQQPDVCNQAWMEFGALMCTPAQPECDRCPFMECCIAYQRGMQRVLPVKLTKAAVQSRYFHYLVLTVRDGVYIRKRPSGDIWQGLFEFPLIEAERPLTFPEFLDQDLVRQWMGALQIFAREGTPEYRHRLSHRLLHVSFFEVDLATEPNLPSDFIWVPWEQMGEYAVPRLIDQYMSHKY